MTLLRFQNAGVCMFLAAFFTTPALADQVSGAEKVPARRRLRLVAAGAGGRARARQ